MVAYDTYNRYGEPAIYDCLQFAHVAESFGITLRSTRLTLLCGSTTNDTLLVATWHVPACGVCKQVSSLGQISSERVKVEHGFTSAVRRSHSYCTRAQKGTCVPLVNYRRQGLRVTSAQTSQVAPPPTIPRERLPETISFQSIRGLGRQ